MKYQLNGFRADRIVANDGLLHIPVATTIVFTKGQIVVDNGSGYGTNVGTAFANTFWGICAGDADNTSGADGAIKVPVIPVRQGYSFWVKNESATVAAQTDIGEIVDLDSNDGVDVTDTTCIAYGFQIEEIDISTAALAANAGGFVRGRIITMDQD